MRWFSLRSTACFVLGVLLASYGIGAKAIAEEGGKEAPLETSASLEVDKEFEKFVGSAELAAAGADFDPSTLADLAEKLSAGERALSRPPAHGVTSDAAFKLAIQAAMVKRDVKSLDALEIKLRGLNKLELAARAAAVKRLVAAKRDVAPVASVSVDELLELAPDVLADFQASIHAIKAAQISGDRQALEAAKAHAQSENGWLVKQKEYASKLIASIESELPAEADASLVDITGKLSAASRFFPKAPMGPTVVTRSYPITLMNSLRTPIGFVIVSGNKTVKPAVGPNSQTTVNVIVTVDSRSGQWKHPVTVSLANVSNSTQGVYSPARFVVNLGPGGKPRLARVQ